MGKGAYCRRPQVIRGGAPTGTVINFMGTTAPKGYLACDGTEYNIADYKNLADFITEQFGTVNNFGGDGTTTFAVPNLSGEFLRGTGTNGHENQGSGADVGVHQEATWINRVTRGSSGATVFIDNDKVWITAYYYDSLITAKAYRNITGRSMSWWYIQNKGSTVDSADHGFYTSRPTNTSVLYCIKY